MAEPFYYLSAETVVPRDAVHVIIGGSITFVAPFTFSCHPNLARVEFQEGVEVIGRRAFADCPNLARVDFPSSLHAIDDRAFLLCPLLLEFILREGLRRIGTGAFFGCDSLRCIAVPLSVVEIGKRAFAYCRNLEAVTLAGGEVMVAREALFGCPRLPRILIPSVAIVVEAGEDGNGRVAAVTGGIEDGDDDAPKPARLILSSRYLALMNQEDLMTLTDAIDQIADDQTQGAGPLDLEDEGVAHRIRAGFANCLEEYKADIAAVLELALWKAKMNQTAGVDAPTRDDCRINCGAEDVVGNVVYYLWGPHRRVDQG